MSQLKQIAKRTLSADIKFSASNLFSSLVIGRAYELRGAKPNQQVRSSRRNGDFQHTVTLVREEFVGFLDLVQFEAMRDQRLRIHSPRADHLHQTAHRLIAARTKRGEDPVVAGPGKDAKSVGEGKDV